MSKTVDSSRWAGRTLTYLLCKDGKSRHWAIQIGPNAFCFAIGNTYSDPSRLWMAVGRRYHARMNYFWGVDTMMSRLFKEKTQEASDDPS